MSKPLPLLELVKARQTEPRQGTASEAAEPRQSTPGPRTGTGAGTGTGTGLNLVRNLKVR